MKTGRISRAVLAALLFGVALSGCASTTPEQGTAADEATQYADLILDHVPAFAGPPPEIISGNDIYKLTAEQEAEFLSFFRSITNREMPPHKRLVKFLELSAGKFEYRGETHTAADTFSQKGGNCLSLANLTTALARIANIDVGYQLMDDLPVFEKLEDIILRGEHVRSVLYEPKMDISAAASQSAPKMTISPSGGNKIFVDYFPTGRARYLRRISENEFTAMFFRNLAAEALAAHDLSDAYWYNRESLKYAPNHPDAINTLAVLYRRSGDDVMAERVYRYALDTHEEKPALLKNYRLLLDDQGRTAEADEMTRRLEAFSQNDPFEWWFLGEDAFQEANYSAALNYYKKSVEIAPYLHEGYFGMAKTYYRLGRLNSARHALDKAVENAQRVQFRQMYEAKLAALNGQ